MSELILESRDLEDVTLLYPKGFINAHTVRIFESEIQKALLNKRFKIVINCTGLAYIASAGLGAIMGAIEEIRSNGGDLRLANLNETVQNIFEILGFNHLYRIFPSEMEAIMSFRRGEGPVS
ncbi:MAG TPA: STAS domain-containing protein [Vicinamibacteria bacterium]|jgi:anti-sigma B factor antagonist|nr:STAS domain-containing protein [Vicinamibacteria bacterium]